MSGAGLPAQPAWFRFARGGAPFLGAVDPTADEPRWYDLGPLDVVALLQQGALRRDDLAARIGSAAPMAAPDRLLAPVPRGGKILCLAKNYVKHAREFGAEAPDEPIFFAKLPDTLVGPGDDVVIPRWLTTRVDHEAELGLILGFADPDDRGRKNVDERGAAALVAGYTVVNDVTARKLQGQDRDRKYPWLRAKAIDTFCPAGPFVVPADAIDGADLRVVMRVNGELRQDARTSEMVFAIERALQAMSLVTTLRPGDLIAMGTPEGVSAVVPGDLMEVEVEGLGVLRNRVVAEAETR
ncbi:MAG: fumarylacetoacetate hydrolase family protein [Planctomycetes bacterium]|nr:fumarylacetoacetate hydrolase family protein [Planctomycetota bacterium]